jgi:hypothetical protein
MPKAIITNIRTAEFEIAVGTRLEQEAAIAEKLRLKEGIIWVDDPKGVRTVVIDGHDVWRPRERFKLGE